jgi:tetratricopeptide (TPR) repeat protein
MTPELYSRLKGHFVAARDLPPADRAAYVAQVAGDDAALQADLEELLAAHDREEQQPAGTPPPSPGFPAHVAGYQILRIVGEGGMGVVFEAEQARPRRRVALKVIRPGFVSPRLRRRFEQEAQVLGRLQHPGIAQIFEAGLAEIGADQQPYFAMEFVAGQPVTDYASRAGLDARARLELLARVSDAVEHAHQRGVIHRDLKPANILVDATGQPKILDFGIARAVDAEGESTRLRTETGQLLGTVPYMSPEQFETNLETLDTRADIYALGVIGFELLTGQLPFELAGKGLLSAARTIREEEPLRLGRVSRALGGDPETIIHKALEKDRQRRYPTAAEMAADIRRYLADQPIRARPPSRAYEFRKLVARHKLPAALLALLFASIAGFGVWMSVLYTRAEAHRVRAVAAQQAADAAALRADEEARSAPQEATTALRVKNFLVDLFRMADPREAKGAAITAREILERGTAGMAAGLEDEPLVRAAVLEVTGEAYFNLGLYGEARPLVEEALRIRQELLSGDHRDVVQSQNRLGVLLMHQGEYEQAETLLLASLATAERTHDDPALARCWSNLGMLIHHRGFPTQAEEYFRNALDLLRTLPDPEPRDLAGCENNLGAVLQLRGKLAEAEPLLRAALDRRRRTYGDVHPDVVESQNNLAALLHTRGDLAEAGGLYRQALESWRQLVGPEHPRVASTLQNLASIRRRQRDFEGAEQLYGEALAMLHKLVGERHPQVARCLNGLGMVLSDKGDFVAAARVQGEALALQRELLDAEHPDISDSLNNLAVALQELKRFDEAEPLLREAIGIDRRRFGDNHPMLASSLNNLAMLLDTLGERVEAEILLREAVAIDRRTGNKATLAAHLSNLGKLLLGAQRHDEAEVLLREALALRETVVPAGDWRLANTRLLLAACIADQGRYPEAEGPLLAAYSELEAALGPANERTRRARQRLVALYEAWNRPADAACWQSATAP